MPHGSLVCPFGDFRVRVRLQSLGGCRRKCFFYTLHNYYIVKIAFNQRTRVCNQFCLKSFLVTTRMSRYRPNIFVRRGKFASFFFSVYCFRHSGASSPRTRFAFLSAQRSESKIFYNIVLKYSSRCRRYAYGVLVLSVHRVSVGFFFYFYDVRFVRRSGYKVFFYETHCSNRNF